MENEKNDKKNEKKKTSSGRPPRAASGLPSRFLSSRRHSKKALQIDVLRDASHIDLAYRHVVFGASFTTLPFGAVLQATVHFRDGLAWSKSEARRCPSRCSRTRPGSSTCCCQRCSQHRRASQHLCSSRRPSRHRDFLKNLPAHDLCDRPASVLHARSRLFEAEYLKASTNSACWVEATKVWNLLGSTGPSGP